MKVKKLGRKYYDGFLTEHARRHNPRYNNLAQWVQREIALLDKARDFPKEKPNARELVIDAEELIARGEYAKAETRLTKAVETEPRNVDLWMKRMDLRARYLKNPEGAREDCEAILELAPKTPLAYLYLAYLSPDAKRKEEYFRKV